MMLLLALLALFAAVCLLLEAQRAHGTALIAMLVLCTADSMLINRPVVESVGSPLPGYQPLPLVLLILMVLALLAGWRERLQGEQRRRQESSLSEAERLASSAAGVAKRNTGLSALGIWLLGLCRGIFWLLLVCSAVLDAALLAYFHDFGSFGAEQFIGLLQTTPREALEGSSRYLGWRMFGYVSLLCACIFAPYWVRCPVRAMLMRHGVCGWRWRPLVLLGTALMSVVILLPSSNLRGDHVLYAACKAYAEYQDNLRQRHRYAVAWEKHTPNRMTGEHYILVIGESASAAHMSAYGYFRDTTPWLRTVAEQPQTVLLRRALSVHSYTLYTVPLLLSKCSQGAYADVIRCKTIINAMKERGYKTWWISNQEKTGTYGSLYNTLGAEADEVFFTHNSYDFQKGYDTDLLPRIRRALRENPQEAKCIVVHIMGSHDVYARRYPPDFRPGLLPAVAGFWGAHSPEKQAVIDSYDTSIAFTDAFLHALTDLFAPEEKAVLFYLSDHGESTVGNFLHDSSKELHPDMFRIPAFLWVTPAFLASRGDRVQALTARQNSFFLNDHACDLLSYLSGEEEVRPDDIFVEDACQVRTRHNASAYDDLTHRVIARKLHTLRTRTKEACLLAHSNSLAKVQLAQLYGFDGVQIDLHPEEGQLVVGEDSQRSAHLPLEPYLKLLQAWKGSCLWLRLPDLSPAQAQQFRQELNELARCHAFKERCILQLPPALAVLPWKADGWHTSATAPASCDVETLPPAQTCHIPDTLVLSATPSAVPEPTGQLVHRLEKAVCCTLHTEADL